VWSEQVAGKSVNVCQLVKQQVLADATKADRTAYNVQYDGMG